MLPGGSKLKLYNNFFKLLKKQLLCCLQKTNPCKLVLDNNRKGQGLQYTAAKRGGLIVGIYKSLTETRMWQLGTRPCSFISGNICFEFSVPCLCSVACRQARKKKEN